MSSIPHSSPLAYVALDAVWSVAWVAAASGFEKQRRPSGSVAMWRQLSADRLSFRSARSITIALGMIELGIGSAVLVSAGTLTGSLLAALFALLTIGAAGAKARTRGRVVPCGCFGEHGGTLSWAHVALNAFLAVLVAAALIIGPATPELASAPVLVGLATSSALIAILWWWLYAQAGSSPYRATAHSE